MQADMKTSIATVSISGALDAKLRAIAAAGFGGVEIFENDLLSSHLSSREICALMRDLGVLRDRRTSWLPGLRCSQCADPASRSGAPQARIF
jgi:hypothetical protein